MGHPLAQANPFPLCRLCLPSLPAVRESHPCLESQVDPWDPLHPCLHGYQVTRASQAVRLYQWGPVALEGP